MTEQELLKGYYCRRSNLINPCVFVFRNVEHSSILQSFLDIKKMFIIKNISVDQLDSTINLFFDLFPTVKVGSISYLVEEKTLRFHDLERNLEKFEEEKFLELQKHIDLIPTYYTIRVGDLLKEIYFGMLEESRCTNSFYSLANIVDGISFIKDGMHFNYYSQLNRDYHISVIYDENTKDMFRYDRGNERIHHFISKEKERIIKDFKQSRVLKQILYTKNKIEITKDVFLTLDGPCSSILYQDHAVNIRSLVNGRTIPFTKFSHIYNSLKDYELDLRSLSQPLQEYLITKNETRIDKNKKELLLTNLNVKR